ncbi:unnamed protein product [Arabidopsis lyrata]|nr:unnamed protein product [Arabidopsis lyrata]
MTSPSSPDSSVGSRTEESADSSFEQENFGRINVEEEECSLLLFGRERKYT